MPQHETHTFVHNHAYWSSRLSTVSLSPYDLDLDAVIH